MDDEASLSQRVAVVTGGEGFIGRAIARRLESLDYEVVALDRSGKFEVDLRDEEEVRSVARRVLKTYGRCDVLVHAAVAFERASLADLEAKLWHDVLAVNVESALWLMQELTPAMMERQFGRIVLLVSDTFWNPPSVPDMLPYIASKGALIGIARALARPLGGSGITINCVAPGLTPPPVANDGFGPAVIEDVRTRQALPRSLVPDDVAEVVGFLASPSVAAVTGQTICPDGGLVLL